MGKIVEIKNKKDKNTNNDKSNLLNYLDQIKKMVENGEILNLMIGGLIIDPVKKYAVKEVITGYCNLNMLERQYIISALQMDINVKVCEGNLYD